MKIKPGDEVKIKIRDHASGTTKLVKCTVYGRVKEVTKTKVVVESWTVEADAECQDENNDRYAIIRSAIIDCQKARFK